ncbi:hypothetical protein ACFYYL_39080, partial [Actinomadura geliboluensis]|uniref:hypothetical protein n=1 Tax=Actinomadura geliboluensis TaxID=882440 RepID=UPI0036CAD185
GNVCKVGGNVAALLTVQPQCVINICTVRPLPWARPFGRQASAIFAGFEAAKGIQEDDDRGVR